MMAVSRTDLAAILAARRADSTQPMCPENRLPTPAELHAEDVLRGAVRVNEDRLIGGYCVLLPCEEVAGRWLTVDAFASQDVAEAFAAGYCTRRDQQIGQPPVAVASPRRLSLIR
jgi:hypothetical protein